MKRLVTISLFIFWAVVVAILIAGLLFYQKTSQDRPIVTQTKLNLAGITLTPGEIAKHNLSTDCWLVIGSKIYDVTSYLNFHPGGAEAIARHCGQDVQVAFDTKDRILAQAHSAFAHQLLSSYYIGDLNQRVQSIDPNVHPAATPQIFQTGDD